MERTKNGFDSLSEPMFIKTLNTITGKMNGNSNFLTLKTAVDALIADQEEYLTLSKNAVNGGTQAILLRDVKRAAIVTSLRNLGNNVTAIAAGDIVVLESSGFLYTKPKQPKGPLVKPEALKVMPGENKGEILCKAKKQGDNSVNYMICADEPGANWSIYSTSKASFLFTNLQSGKNYLMKYELVGTRNQTVVSDTTSYIPQ
ncbi:MAG: hypothetical protein JWQ96_1030 [Segetibacter sp.]|nr:hypothetical protein [Segetibacter sp.]